MVSALRRRVVFALSLWSAAWSLPLAACVGDELIVGTPDASIVYVVADAGGADVATDGGAQATTPASCIRLPATCGGTKDQDCCSSRLVPGGTFGRGPGLTSTASVSDFKLDVYEVTVGRFRAFVEAGGGTQVSPPALDAGAHPLIAGSGWDSAFSARLMANTGALRVSVRVDPAVATWTDIPSGSETHPQNLVTFFTAFAFCAWDGGRLPTEAEWEYAAIGGGEQRTYSWGNDAVSSYRVSNDCRREHDGGPCGVHDILPVGSLPLGNGKWGQSDLTGSVWEWVLDALGPNYPSNCHDCAELHDLNDSRLVRGGSLFEASVLTMAAARTGRSPEAIGGDVGWRCARSAQ